MTKTATTSDADSLEQAITLTKAAHTYAKLSGCDNLAASLGRALRSSDNARAQMRKRLTATVAKKGEL